MKLKIKITTPKGNAKGTMNKIKWFFRLTKGHLDTYVNKEDSMIFIDFEGSIKQCFDIQKKVIMYQKMPQLVLDNKVFRSSMKNFGKATDEQFEQVREMFISGTTIEIVKNATSQEIVEHNKTFWDKIKETYQKTID